MSVEALDDLRAEVGPAAVQVGVAAKRLADVAAAVRQDPAAVSRLAEPVLELRAGVDALRATTPDLDVLPDLDAAVAGLITQGATAADAAASVQSGIAAAQAVADEVLALVALWDEGGSRSAQIEQLGDVETMLRDLAARTPSGPEDCRDVEVQWTAAAAAAAEVTAQLVDRVRATDGNGFDEIRQRERPLVGADISPTPITTTCPALGALDQSLAGVTAGLGDVETALNPTDLVEQR